MQMEPPEWSEDGSEPGRTARHCEVNLSPLRDGMAEG